LELPERVTPPSVFAPGPKNGGVSSSDFERELQNFIIKNSNGLGVNLPMLLRFYSQLNNTDFEELLENRNLYMKYYMKLYRFLKSLAEKGLVEVSKVDGFLWVKPRVDLIKVNIVKFKLVNSPRFKHPYRFEASGLLMRKHELSSEDWRELDYFLHSYVDDVSGRVIVLKHCEMDRFRFLRYRHRFLKRELERILKRYDLVFENAGKLYDEAVFLTLTMNPSTYSNLYQASRRISESFNRFMSYLARLLGFRPLYIAVFEPMDSGNPHLHVIIFGISRIMEHFELTEILVKHGFGIIHYEYAIKKTKDGNWVWRNRANKPKTKTMDVKAYLKKYLVKVFHRALSDKPWKQSLSISDYKLAYYFASNKRFFTCSRALMVKSHKEYSGLWVFIGSWYWLNVPNWILEFANVTLAPSTEFVWRLEALDG